VFDLPLFTKVECSDFAHILCNFLNINLENGIEGIPFGGIDNWLEERFGGVIGYIAEMLNVFLMLVCVEVAPLVA